jgi:hypothetical protein
LVQDVEITPQNPKPGDPINIKIKGTGDEMAPVELNYEQTVQVAGHMFNVQINKVQVPWPKNKLFIEAKNVATLKVAAKFLFWISKNVEVVNGVAQYTLKDVPRGTYSVKLNGSVPQGTSTITIKITAFSELQLDKAGSCVYAFHPSPEHEGNLAVKCNQVEKHVEIKNPQQ